MTFSKLFDGLSGCQLFCAFCFLISSFFVAPNPYAGFVAIFTGLFSIFHIVGSWYFLRRNIGLATYGAVLGSSCVMVFVYIETAVFFGQYSACETPDYHYYGYLRRYGVACGNTDAMTSLCVFSVLLFLLQLAVTSLQIYCRVELLGPGSDFLAPEEEGGEADSLLERSDGDISLWGEGVDGGRINGEWTSHSTRIGVRSSGVPALESSFSVDL